MNTNEGQSPNVPIQPSAPVMQQNINVNKDLQIQQMQMQMQQMQMQMQNKGNHQVNINMGGEKRHNNRWDANIFNICSGGGCNCMYAFCCPTSMMASTRTKYDGSNSFFNKCCMTPCGNRNVVREGYRIRGNCASDICYSCCLLPCAAIQMANEVSIRGPNRQGM